MIVKKYRFKELREKSGLTQKIIAEKVGLKLHSYKTAEREKNGFSFDVLVKLSFVFGCSVNDFLTEEHKETLKNEIKNNSK